ncbi:MAG: RNA-binding S4 domain-containing protein [Acutalibacteraceae bacterium]|nr:RNA-binding S4 domain-containing protein [Clostridia bacterium]MEE1127774.1 RNA-binding S4 domain-containing protein [Acutalibacteraceae bacterium]MBQ2000919.1 RNA-binding S4 domain-containing protein [Clostridia bacterium]MBQ2318994.1 RNA-binding S4 domain-containing protein [Clostridia bacterium]MBQ2388413.1 RNA-binding S4 domain-containing protein [Clostridia bacterium]
MTEITITTEFIRLDSFLKLANLVGSGGQAKMIIQDGLVKVNDEVCTMRGKKLYGGEVVDVDGEVLKVKKA